MKWLALLMAAIELIGWWSYPDEFSGNQFILLFCAAYIIDLIEKESKQ